MAKFQISASKTSEALTPLSQQTPAHWVCPSPLRFNLNTNVAVHSSERFVGVGGVICDHLGCVVACWALKLPGLFSPKIGELLAIREGLRIGLAYHFMVLSY
ncbi:hypothetical protein PanWU01x14_170330 [Parasponia andersonii]|uniref:RNase H type-1 domain-containing protein n=1 Tax=Parasponia andersonii TaxID=3476 RepID=A0A2P5CA72_PARAD|nr:hypothetical protein PanWU01x14_170330 [Parasponia andersonii]